MRKVYITFNILFDQTAGVIWEDPSLDDWPDNDFRIFVGDLGNEVSDEVNNNYIY